MMTSDQNADSGGEAPVPIGYRCGKNPDAPLIPLHALYDPCGEDKLVWSDGCVCGDGQVCFGEGYPDDPGFCQACADLDGEEHCLRCPCCPQSGSAEVSNG